MRLFEWSDVVAVLIVITGMVTCQVSDHRKTVELERIESQKKCAETAK